MGVLRCCTNIVVQSDIQKESRNRNRTTIFFFFFLFFFFLFRYVIKGIPEERSRGSKVQKNCAFIREDDARPISTVIHFFLHRRFSFLSPSSRTPTPASFFSILVSRGKCFREESLRVSLLPVEVAFSLIFYRHIRRVYVNIVSRLNRGEEEMIGYGRI